MRHLEIKISQINDALYEGLNHLTCDFKGLALPVENKDIKTRVEAGTELQVSLNSDSDITGYHAEVGDIDYSKFQNRGKKKVYFPEAPLALFCMCKDRELEDRVVGILKAVPGITITRTSNDKYQIWKEENGNSEVNFDYHIFKVSYNYNFKTEQCNLECA